MDKHHNETAHTTKVYGSPVALLAACWDLPQNELDSCEFGGLDKQKMPVEGLTVADMIQGIEQQKVWGFVDDDNCIHFWAAPDVSLSVMVHFFAHELGHHTGAPLTDHVEEELRAESFGEVATQSLELAIKAIGELPGKSLLMSRENPGGWKLESLTEKLREEINRKSLMIASDPSIEAQCVTNNNFQIIGLLMQVEALQRESMVILSQRGPDEGPTSSPRVG